MQESAMRDADGNVVFSNSKGEYTERFPEEDIVHRAETDEIEFKVYGFIGNHGDFEEQEWVFEEQEDALDFATKIYGDDSIDTFNRDGEVFEVEVHKIDN